MRKLALVTLLCFGCATVRVPATTAAEPSDAPGTIAPPLLDLWMESSEPVSPQAQARAAEQARAAIDMALSRQKVSPGALGAGDAVLFVRERAVGLTPQRRSQQAWAKVGIVAGIVVVVAVIVAAAVSGGASKRPPGAKAKPAASAVPVQPRAAALGPRPVAHPVSPAPLPPPQRYPRAYVYGGYGYAPSPFIWDLDFYYARPLVLRSDEAAPQPFPGAPPPPADESVPEQAASPTAPPPLALPPLAGEATFAVDERGFFSGAQTALQLDLLDRQTGAVLWSRAVQGDADPLNPDELSALLDHALEGAPWARRTR